MKGVSKMRLMKNSVTVFICLVVVCVLFGCEKNSAGLAKREVAVADLFHEDGVYLFLHETSSEEQFQQTLGVTREAICDATTEWGFRGGEMDPLYTIRFESLPAMIMYFEAGGFSVLLNTENIAVAELQTISERIFTEIEAQTGVRLTYSKVKSRTTFGDVEIRVGYSEVEGQDVITSLNFMRIKQK